ncbi:hypothetical protein GCM10027048_16720 [Hymenobacter coalescens]
MSVAPLYHLVYQSAATSLFTEAQLQALLAQSRAWNTAHGITGVLLYCHGHILQVLEGPRNEVQGIFASISRDLRHHDVTKLADGPLTRRSFAEWSMGFTAIEPADYVHLAGFRTPEGLTSTVAGDALLHSVLTEFVRRETVRL